MNQIDDVLKPPTPTKKRPLLGATFLLVEDSRLAAEGFRLMCLHSGARIRRADSLATARRHLRGYRPNVTLIDMTLPDGTGDALIAELAGRTGECGAIIAISGDAAMEARALAAGAHAFLLKPLSRISEFQAAILPHLPPERRPHGPRAIVDMRVEPDPVAYRDDLRHASLVLAQPDLKDGLGYVTQFLDGVARTAQDRRLGRAVAALEAARHGDGPSEARIAELRALIDTRIGASTIL